ncbi:MAG: Clp protease ClpP [Sporomusaceae bacterium]|nr:Clp protease ClpP [Sporomusaceae bacterium]
MKFWNFQQGSQPNQVELRINGDIVDDSDAWFYDWFDIPVASPNAFRDELAQCSGKNITVWIDSDGGSVFAATGIYNALMQHKASGAKVTTIIDSRAMSAATIIFMAGDERKVSPCALFMMHNPLTSVSGYASDLRKAADVLDTVKNNIINAYQLATGKDRAKISAMMDLETYMDAQTTVKEGFATEMVNASQCDSNQIMNFSFNRLSIQNKANASMQSFFEFAKQMTDSAAQIENKEENVVEINTIEDLKKEKPDLYNQVTQGVLNNERARIKALDALDNLQNKAIHEIVNDAKATGKTADEIKTFVEIINRNSGEDKPPAGDPPAAPTNTATATHPFAQIITDSAASGVNGVGTGIDPKAAEKQQDDDLLASMASVINKRNGVSK